MATGTTGHAFSGIQIRKARPEEAAICGRICYEAFRAIATTHNFPPDFPNADTSTGLLATLFSHPRFHCVVAETGGNVVGSNCLDERGIIAGVGPITVDPVAQNSGTGKLLMDAVLTRVKKGSFAGVRLLQAAYHNRSLSLYAKLGFDVREPIATMQGAPIKVPIPGHSVRPAQMGDLGVGNQLCRAVHGFDRSGDLADAIGQGTAVVAERAGRVVAYATAIGFLGHSVAEDNAALQALIASADSFFGPGILVPTRNARLFRWCLDHGLKVVQPMSLMTMGLYGEPAGAYLPSILY